MTEKRLPSLAFVFLAYVVALAVAAVVIRFTETPFGAFVAGLAADVVATIVIFVFSMVYHNSSTYDPYWHVVPPVLYIYWVSRTGGLDDPRVALVLIVALVWSIRLTSNWVRDWPGMGHEDWRYVEFREQFGKAYPAVSLGAIHMFPTAIVALASVPAWLAVTTSGGGIGAWEILGTIVGLGGAVLSFIADEQMRRHRRGGKGGVMAGGLWSLSRHPNYLGEIMFWFGLWFLALGASDRFWWAGAGAFAMLAMFLFKSIPWMEEKIRRTRPEYEDVVSAVLVLVPVPGRRMTPADETA